MASLQKRKRTGRESYLIQFLLSGSRRTLFLGARYDKKFAQEAQKIVENIVNAIVTGVDIDKRTRAWLEAIGDDLRERFERAGLIEREQESKSIRDVYDYFIKYRSTKLKPSTFSTYEGNFQRFAKYFDVDRPASDLTKNELNEVFARFSREYSGPTVSGTLSILYNVII